MRTRVPEWGAVTRSVLRWLGTALVVFAAASPLTGELRAADEAWHPTLEKGVEAAKKSGKPLLIVTAWKSGI